MLPIFISIAAAALYAIASAQLYYTIRTRVDALALPADGQAEKSPGGTRNAWLVMAAAAAVLHSWVAVMLTGFPSELKLPFFTAISVTALVVVLLLLALCLFQPADYIGLIVFPVAAIALLAGQIHQRGEIGIDLSVKFHVLLSLAAYAVLALAAAQALLVAAQRHHLNTHKPSGFVRALPPLERTETLLFALLTAGFVMLSLSLGSGWAYLDNMFAQQVAHKTILSCIAWAIFAYLLFGRWRFGWRGKRATNWTLGGFAVLIVAYFGSKLVLELILQR